MKALSLGLAVLITSSLAVPSDAGAGIFGRHRCCRTTCCKSGGSSLPRGSSELQAQILQLQNIIEGQQAIIGNHEQRVRQLEAQRAGN